MFGCPLSRLAKREHSDIPRLLLLVNDRLNLSERLPDDLYVKSETIARSVLRSVANGELPPLSPTHYIALLRLLFQSQPEQPNRATLLCLFEFVARTSRTDQIKNNLISIINFNVTLERVFLEWRLRSHHPNNKLHLTVTSTQTSQPSLLLSLSTGSNKLTLKHLRMFPEGNKKNILAIDGGGMRGLFALATMRTLCRLRYGDSGELGTKKFLANFNLIAGTSTGAIIAAALGIGCSIDLIVSHYLELGEKVFVNHWSSLPTNWYRSLRKGCYYDHRVLTEELHRLVGERMLTELQLPTLLVATDKSTAEFEPFLLRSYDSLNTHLKGSMMGTIVESIRASAAAPTYFEPITLKFTEDGLQDEIELIDGGMVANNPTELAIFEAYHLWPHDTLGMIVSFGTGSTSPRKGYTNILEFGKDILNLVTNSEAIHRRICEWLESEQHPIDYFRFDPTGLGGLPLDCTNLNQLQQGIEISEHYLTDQPQLAHLIALLQ